MSVTRLKASQLGQTGPISSTPQIVLTSPNDGVTHFYTIILAWSASAETNLSANVAFTLLWTDSRGAHSKPLNINQGQTDGVPTTIIIPPNTVVQVVGQGGQAMPNGFDGYIIIEEHI